MKMSNCDGYAKMMLVNIKRDYGLVAQVTQYGQRQYNTRRCLVLGSAMIIHRLHGTRL